MWMVVSSTLVVENGRDMPVDALANLGEGCTGNLSMRSL